MKVLKGVVLVEATLALLPLALPVLLGIVLGLSLVAYFLVTPLYIAVAAYLGYRLVKWWRGRWERLHRSSREVSNEEKAGAPL